MLRCLLPLLWLVLGSMAAAAAAPEVDLTASPAWAGWSRPGRASEIDIRLRSQAAVRVTLVVTAGRQALRTEVDIQPGRAVRLQLPVPAAETVQLRAAAAGGAAQQRDIRFAPSESPVLGVGLGVGLAAGGPVQLPGFHTVVLGADDLPRHASAHASVDALLLDAATLAALDERQLAALLEHAAACGRVVLIDPDARLQRVLQGAGRCGGRTLDTVASLAQGLAALESSLSARFPAALAPADLAALAPTGQPLWDRVAVALAVCLGAVLLAAVMATSFTALVLTPALAAAAVLAWLQFMPRPAQLVVWSQAESGEAVARYQARQQFSGVARETVRLPVPPQLATSAQPCNALQAMTLDFDMRSSQVASAEFGSRLFRQTALCYSGSFPTARAMSTQARADGSRELANTGSKAWPAGLLLAAGRAHELPALGPGERLTLAPGTGRLPVDAVVRTAWARTPPEGAAALWPLDLAGVAALPPGARGWLLVTEAAP